MPRTRSAPRMASAVTVWLRCDRRSRPRAAMAVTDPGLAEASPGSSPADDTVASTPSASRRARSRTSAIGERHWLAVHSTRISMRRVYGRWEVDPSVNAREVDRMPIDPRTPVLVGAGQLSEKVAPQDALEPVDM